jgi:lipoprotein-anchoring transpeptidase ErfK/SrfK
MKTHVRILLIGLLFAIVPTSSIAHTDFVDVRIDLSKQKMEVIVVGYHEFTWDISTARRGYRTPTGDFRINWMTSMHYSEQYDMSPMPHAIFFNKGIAIHGTEEIKRLGQPASHGCVRLHPENARILYQLVEIYGMGNTKISVKKRQPSVTEKPKEKFPVMFNESRF